MSSDGLILFPFFALEFNSQALLFLAQVRTLSPPQTHIQPALSSSYLFCKETFKTRRKKFLADDNKKAETLERETNGKIYYWEESKLMSHSVLPCWEIYVTLGKFLKHLATINLPKYPTFVGNFCKDVKIYHFSSEITFGQLL